jgi:hypothetical protein
VRSRRPGTSLVLIFGAIILLISIAVGQRLGDSVLRQVTEQRSTEATAILTPVPPAPQPTDLGPVRNWKHEQVVSVATDPAFPDPRATPKPTPKPTPTANPTIPPPPTPAPPQDLAPGKPLYTSPPLPVPIASHAPEDVDTEPPDANGYPQGIPPVTPEPAPTQP